MVAAGGVYRVKLQACSSLARRRCVGKEATKAQEAEEGACSFASV